MLRKVGAPAEVTAAPDSIRRANAIILPGVGHFDHCAKALRAAGLVSLLEERVRGEKVPLLGICVGMQLLGRGSEEGDAEGLGWVQGQCKRFTLSADLRLPIPHMGWAMARP